MSRAATIAAAVVMIVSLSAALIISWYFLSHQDVAKLRPPRTGRTNLSFAAYVIYMAAPLVVLAASDISRPRTVILAHIRSVAHSGDVSTFKTAQFEKHFRERLDQTGYTRAENERDADLILELAFRQDSPHETIDDHALESVSLIDARSKVVVVYAYHVLRMLKDGDERRLRDAILIPGHLSPWDDRRFFRVIKASDGSYYSALAGAKTDMDGRDVDEKVQLSRACRASPEGPRTKVFLSCDQGMRADSPLGPESRVPLILQALLDAKFDIAGDRPSADIVMEEKWRRPLIGKWSGGDDAFELTCDLHCTGLGTNTAFSVAAEPDNVDGLYLEQQSWLDKFQKKKPNFSAMHMMSKGSYQRPVEGPRKEREPERGNTERP